MVVQVNLLMFGYMRGTCHTYQASFPSGQCSVFSTNCWPASASETSSSSSVISLLYLLPLNELTQSSTCSTWWPSVVATSVSLSVSFSPSVSPSRGSRSYFSVSSLPSSNHNHLSRLCASLIATPTGPGDLDRPTSSPPMCCPPCSWPSPSTSPGYWRYLL